MMKSTRIMLVALVSALALTACGGGAASVPTTSGSLNATGSGATSASAQTRLESSRATAPVIAIDAGSASGTGNWVADTDFTFAGWGEAASYTNPIDTSRVTDPAPQSLYQTQRWAPNLTYTIPNLAPNGAYTVRLHFAECYFYSKGQRVFDVKINNAQVLSNFDLYDSAGGANIALVKTFAVTADGNGTIAVVMNATVNNAVISGVEIRSGSGSPGPAPSAIPSPPPSSNAAAWTFSQFFSSSSPMRTTIATLRSQGAAIVDHQYVDSFWSQGFPTRQFTSLPVYLSKPTDRVVTVNCLFYGGNCDANGLQIHENPADYIQWIRSIQNEEDHHLILIDQNSSQGPVELDCWQAGPRSSASTLVGSNLQCGWAGLYHLGSNGLHGVYPNQNDPAMEGFHFGPAAGSFMVTGTEILNGHIDHALALSVSCLNNPSVYPADTFNGTDTSCDGGSNPPHYGNAIHLTWSHSQIANSAYSAPCKTILTALADYGAYLSDTGDQGTTIDVEAEQAYISVGAYDPYPTIKAQMNAAGDAVDGNWMSCFNRLSSNDFEMLQLAHP